MTKALLDVKFLEASGWPTLDERTKGLRAGQLMSRIGDAGHDSSGKSAFVSQLITQAIKDGKEVIYINLEIECQNFSKCLK